MATDVKINDIASQLNTASRLVVTTDFFWIYMANGSQVKIPAEFVRAYLSDGLKPTVGENGNWYVGGVDTSVKAEAVAPLFRGGAVGIEVSYDKGQTWETAVEYSDMNPDLEPLVEAYKKVTEGEEERISNENARKQSELDRQAAENTRKTNETNRSNAEAARAKAEIARDTAEKARASAESKRETDFAASKAAADKATARSDAQTALCKIATDNANTATNNCKTQTDLAQELNDNPLKQGDNGNWWKYNPTTKEYEDTGVAAIGGILYPSFYNHRNHLFLVDYQQYVSNRVSYTRNHLRIKI